MHITGRRDILVLGCGCAEGGEATGVTVHGLALSSLGVEVSEEHEREGNEHELHSLMERTSSSSGVFWGLCVLTVQSFLTILKFLGNTKRKRLDYLLNHSQRLTHIQMYLPSNLEKV